MIVLAGAAHLKGLGGLLQKQFDLDYIPDFILFQGVGHYPRWQRKL